MELEEQYSLEESDRNNGHLRLRIITTTFTGLIMVILFCVWLGQFAPWTPTQGHTQVNVNVHIIIMVTFFIFFHGLVNLIHRIFPDAPTLKVKFVHFFLHLVVILGVVTGLFFAINHHEIKKDWHCYSLHSWIGLLAIILYFGQFLVFLTKFAIFLFPFIPMGIRKLILPKNESLGPLIFLLSVVASLTGIMMKANNLKPATTSKYEMSSMMINCGGMSILVFATAIICSLRMEK